LLKGASRCCKGCLSSTYPGHDTDCDTLLAPYEAQYLMYRVQSLECLITD